MKRNNKALYEQIMKNISKQIKNVLNEELYVIGYVNGTDDGMAEISIIETFDDQDSAESALEDYEEEYGQTAIDYVNGSGPDLWNEGSEVAGELVFYTKSQYWRGLNNDDDDDEETEESCQTLHDSIVSLYNDIFYEVRDTRRKYFTDSNITTIVTVDNENICDESDSISDLEVYVQDDGVGFTFSFWGDGCDSSDISHDDYEVILNDIKDALEELNEYVSQGSYNLPKLYNSILDYLQRNQIKYNNKDLELLLDDWFGNFNLHGRKVKPSKNVVVIKPIYDKTTKIITGIESMKIKVEIDDKWYNLLDFEDIYDIFCYLEQLSGFYNDENDNYIEIQN